MCVPNALRGIVCDRNRDESSSSIKELMLPSIQPEKRFGFQRKIDEGNVTMWPIKLLCPMPANTWMVFSISNFYKVTYDVGALPKLHKYGRCFVKGHTF